MAHAFQYLLDNILACIAIIIALSSAWYTQVLARNDTKRMRRKKPVLELETNFSKSPIKGWDVTLATIRNIDEIGVVVSGIEAISRAAFVVSFAEAENGRDNMGGPSFPDTLPKSKKTAVRCTVSPRSALTTNTRDNTAAIYIFTQGVEQSTDLKLTWKWADGKKA